MVLKDNDFNIMRGKIGVGCLGLCFIYATLQTTLPRPRLAPYAHTHTLTHTQVGAYLSMLRDEISNDVSFLRQHNVVDYSLLVMVEKTRTQPAKEHYDFVKNNQAALKQAFDELLESTGAKFFTADDDGGVAALSFREFCQLADARSAVRSRMPKDGTISLTTGEVERLPSSGYAEPAKNYLLGPQTLT